MGNCENKCCDANQKLSYEIEKENNTEEYTKNRFNNIVKTKEKVLSEPSIKSISKKSTNVNKDPINFENGCVYEGDWDELNKRHGYGTYKWKDGSVYTGNWADNKAHGYGKLIHPDGDVYEGNWENDKANGYGEYQQKNNILFKGNWLNDKQHGKGVEILGSSIKYEGDYENGVKHGIGNLSFGDGSTYKVS